MGIVLIHIFIVVVAAVAHAVLCKKKIRSAGTLIINKTNPEFDNYLIQIDIPFEDLEKESNIGLKIVIQK